MTALLALLIILSGCVPACYAQREMEPDSAIFYVGTNTKNSESRGIYRGVLDLNSGEILQLALAAEAENPSFLAASPEGQFLFAAMETDEGAVGAFRMTQDGSLTALNQQSSGGKGACHVWVDARGRHVLAANYSSGSAVCLPVAPDGMLGTHTALVEFSGSGPDPKRQNQPHAHAIVTDPDDRFAYVCDLGTDSVHIFKFDPAAGTLVPAEPPAAKVPPGGGPRHIVLHPKADFAYVNNEMGMSVTAFARNRDTGELTVLQTLPTIPGPAEPGHSTSEIMCDPLGRWVYVTNRGPDTIAAFAIQDNGTLKLIGITPAEVKRPRGAAIDPSGRWLIAAGQDDHRLSVLRIDQKTGALSSTGHSVEAPTPVCVLFP